MKNKPTAGNKKQPVTLKDLKTRKNPRGGTAGLGAAISVSGAASATVFGGSQRGH